MKIPLLINEYGLPSVTTGLKAPKYHLKVGNVEFIIDTRSSETDLSEGDAKRLKIPYKRLTKSSDYTEIGGTKCKLYEMKKVTLFFSDSEGNKVEIFFDKFDVRKGTKTKSEEMNKASVIPSILGNDFLMKRKFFLHHNPLKKESYLE